MKQVLENMVIEQAILPYIGAVLEGARQTLSGVERKDWRHGFSISIDPDYKHAFIRRVEDIGFVWVDDPDDTNSGYIHGYVHFPD